MDQVYFSDFTDLENMLRTFSGIYDEDDSRPPQDALDGEFERDGVYWGYGAPAKWKEYDKLTELLKDATILLAWYGPGSYSGQAFVLYEKGGELFEVATGHCSCNGLEYSFEPARVTWEALARFIEVGNGSLPRNEDCYFDGEEAASERLFELVREHVPTVTRPKKEEE